jgi:hypothetical protein
MGPDRISPLARSATEDLLCCLPQQVKSLLRSLNIYVKKATLKPKFDQLCHERDQTLGFDGVVKYGAHRSMPSCHCYLSPVSRSSAYQTCT